MQKSANNIAKLPSNISQSIQWALAEDLGYGFSSTTGSPINSSVNSSAVDALNDVTASLIPKNNIATATIISRDQCSISGIAWVNEVFYQLDPNIQITWHVEDGERVDQNTLLCEISGNARLLLTGERVALNFLQTLSATATTTYQYVQALANTSTKLLDTRKTIPGLRNAQKYAVTCGGGYNHRIGLFDAFLIKENHIAACGGIKSAIDTARENFPNKKVEVEVEGLDELKIALDSEADIVMLDNFSIEMINQAIQLRKSTVASTTKFEVSGNITLTTIANYACEGVDYISVGALTKNIQAVDLSMRFI